MAWLQAHSALISGLAVALIDFAWGLAPNLKANGVLHAVYLFLGGKDSA